MGAYTMRCSRRSLDLLAPVMIILAARAAGKRKRLDTLNRAASAARR
jgi:hypothetical protein